MGRYPATIGPYKVERQLGTGGMGVVLDATHRVLGRRVAIKLRERTTGGDERLLAERFRQGAILQAELAHPYVARVHEYYEMQNLQALILEYLDGGSIDQHLQEARGPLPVSDCVEIGLRAAEALEHAHRKGVIHRDIKPANIMLADPQSPRSVRVTDFGVAKSVENSPDLTMAGANVGTLWYMPPEQFNQEKPTPQADVYSLGATIYEMLTGHIPFESQDTAQIFRRFLDGVPPPAITQRNPSVPGPLAAVVEQALALEREKRTPSAGVLALLLRAVGERDGLINRDSAVQRLFNDTDEQALTETIAHLPPFDGPEVARAVSALESRVLGGTSVRTRADTAQQATFEGIEAMDATPTNVSRPQFTPASIDDDDDDRTMIMSEIPIILDD